MASIEKNTKKEKNQNIQVFVRLRPLNQRERSIRSLGVVEVVNNREVVVQQSFQTTHTKKFTFDRAFGPNVQQLEIYKEVVSPLIAEVLAGYNCTVFAYGQTGTGKTHTMVGESSGEGTCWQTDPLAGIIPRALSQLFDELRITKSEYTVRVSYLEIYNEELFDLLANSTRSDLRIYEDATRKGSIIVHGLEELTVYNKNEVYQIMTQGQERKKVACTQMNAQSSRSHTVFTIVVHMKENCPKGEELVKIGKLNLVDLAGSENISKAGSDNPAKKERARECVNINQSLLTLGRVITALVDKQPHIPYRESKLTRILQESLGGRTKTSIIATVSPGHKDLEETLSTLEYAHRAKNIQNKPEVNQKLTKQAMMKQYAEEMDKLKRDLTAAREKNGVHLHKQTYDEMLLKEEEQRREIQDLLLKKRALEEEHERIKAVFRDLNQKLCEKKQRCAEQEHLVDAHRRTESHLAAQARQLLAAADGASGDALSLHDSVSRRSTVESRNRDVVSTYREQATATRRRMLDDVREHTECFMGARDDLLHSLDNHAKEASKTQEQNEQDMKQLVAKISSFLEEIKSIQAESQAQLTQTAEECHLELTTSASARRDALRAVLAQLVRTVEACVERAGANDVTATVARSTDQWLSGASARVSCLQRAHAAHAEQARALEGRRELAARAHHEERAAALRAREDARATCAADIEKDRAAIEERMSRHLAAMEADREATEQRLQRWVERERRELEAQRRRAEERMQRHLEDERAAMLARIHDHQAELLAHKELYESSVQRCMQMQQTQSEADQREMEMASVYLQECESETEECLKNVKEFDNEFGEGTSAIGAEMEAMTRSVVQIVEHSSGQLMDELHQAKDTIQQAVEEVMSSEGEAMEKHAAAAGAAVRGAARHAGAALGALLHTAEADTSSAIETLSSVRSRSAQLASASQAHGAALAATVARAAQSVAALGAGLDGQLAEQADAEGRYLMHEYRVYTPSGNTPARRDYSYPRRLVATSPHERILARFRDMQLRDSSDSDCVVVAESDESDENGGSSVSEGSGGRRRRAPPSRQNSESPVSEDSAVAMQ